MIHVELSSEGTLEVWPWPHWAIPDNKDTPCRGTIIMPWGGYFGHFNDVKGVNKLILTMSWGLPPYVLGGKLTQLVVLGGTTSVPQQGCILINCYGHYRPSNNDMIITPRTCARGKAIGFVCRRQRNRQISSSRRLCMMKAQRIGRYRRKTGFYALRIADIGLLALQIVHFLFYIPVVYRPHPLCWHVVMRLRMLEVSVGKGRQVTTTTLSAVVLHNCYTGYRAHGVYMYVLQRALLNFGIPIKYGIQKWLIGRSSTCIKYTCM